MAWFKQDFPAAAGAAQREAETLALLELSATSFNGFGKLLQGTRRHNLVYVDDFAAVRAAEDCA